MKVKKKAEQKNVLLNTWYYTQEDIEYYFDRGFLWFFKDEDERTDEYDLFGYSYDEYVTKPDRLIRLDLEKGDELKVVLEKGFYTTALVKGERQFFVEL